MYDFSQQKAMLEAILLLLEENNLSEISTLGGGTALASYYWNHRYSTDIDIFIYDKEDKKHLLKESNWSEKVKTEMKSIGYDGNFRSHPIYSEIVIDKECKIQFFDIAIAFNKEPDILTKTLLAKDKVITLFETVSNIYSNQSLKDLYLEEIQQMNQTVSMSF